MPEGIIWVEHAAGKDCTACGRADNVIKVGKKVDVTYCVICLMAGIDTVMEWKLSNVAIQSLAARAASQNIQAEMDVLESRLPEELRSRKAR